jgi:hypothetical protein
MTKKWSLFVSVFVVFQSIVLYVNWMHVVVQEQPLSSMIIDCGHSISDGSLKRVNTTIQFLGNGNIPLLLGENGGGALQLQAVATSRRDNTKVKCLHNHDDRRRPDGTKMKKRSVPSSSFMVLACVPWDERHLVALWSELECFTQEVDHVVISAPSWAKPIIQRLLDQVQQTVPHFSEQPQQQQQQQQQQNNKMRVVTIESIFPMKNDRYDVGLWCDALGPI